MNFNGFRGEDPPTLSDYERAAHEHRTEAFAEAMSHPMQAHNWNLKQAKRYESICRRLRIMGRT